MADIEPMQKYVRPGHSLLILAVEIVNTVDAQVAFHLDRYELFKKHDVRIVADQSSGDNLTVTAAVDAFARYVRERTED